MISMIYEFIKNKHVCSAIFLLFSILKLVVACVDHAVFAGYD